MLQLKCSCALRGVHLFTVVSAGALKIPQGGMVVFFCRQIYFKII